MRSSRLTPTIVRTTIGPLPWVGVAMVLGVAAGVLAVAPAPLLAQSQALSRSDLAELVEDAHKRQRDYEGYRASRIPVTTETSGGRCDERIGRVCIWYGGEDETDFPPEPAETALARRELLTDLSSALGQVRDPWILGQLVHYLIDDGNYGRAERIAEECGLVETWWCEALVGYVLHLRGEFVEAEAAFRTSIAAMPDEERRRWTTPGRLFTKEGEDTFNRASPDEQTLLWDRLWRFSDPLFLLEGNDRLTDHFARLVEATNDADAADPQDMGWDDDLEEVLVRYGRIIGWSRMRGTPSSILGGGGLQDSRQVVGHHNPKSRGYLFPEQFLEAPAEIPPESWITAPRESRSWYAPPYAPDFTALETQVGRFRRGDEMLVVGAYRPALPGMDPLVTVAVPRRPEPRPDPFDPFGGRRAAPDATPITPETPVRTPANPIRGPVQAGLFLVPENGGEAVEIRGSDAEGVFTLLAPPGRYVSSLEVFEPRAARAWRARQGVSQAPLVRGVAGVSDLLILNEDAPFPTSLDEAIAYVRPGVQVGGSERFTVVWEIYGLQVQEEVQVTLGFTRGRPGFLQRVGEFMGVLEPDVPVEVTFADSGPYEVQTAFRAVALELPDLAPGEYTLHLRLELPGREPVIASRPITVGS
ncbi:MAG: hypothetical protein EXR92_02230 [Gemmatimonadetes bacterium]|nr:hypothetical protein [Gemmatimonadota bacterium]